MTEVVDDQSSAFNGDPSAWRMSPLVAALAINAVGWTLYFLWAARGAYPFGVMSGIVVCAGVLAITSAGVVVIHFLFGRTHAPWLRCSAYTMPSLVLITIALLTPASPPEPNRTQDLPSPSGAYVLSVPIIGDRWRVTIHDKRGSLEYQDAKSDLVGWLRVYWTWDSHDRVWLYNSDDGRVFVWERVGNGVWTKTEWGHRGATKGKCDLLPPSALFPD